MRANWLRVTFLTASNQKARLRKRFSIFSQECEAFNQRMHGEPMTLRAQILCMQSKMFSSSTISYNDWMLLLLDSRVVMEVGVRLWSETWSFGGRCQRDQVKSWGYVSDSESSKNPAVPVCVATTVQWWHLTSPRTTRKTVSVIILAHETQKTFVFWFVVRQSRWGSFPNFGWKFLREDQGSEEHHG